MKLAADIFTVTTDENASCRCLLAEKRECDGVSFYRFELFWDRSRVRSDSEVRFEWCVPMLGFMYMWAPMFRERRCIQPEWGGERISMISSGAPLISVYDGNTRNRYTWAVDECKKLLSFKSGVLEETGELKSVLRMGLEQFTGENHTELTFRIDSRDISFCDAVGEVAAWWEDCGMKPAYVPDAAKDPAYSFWYSYHQNVYEKEVEAECARAKKLGFDVCIVDDGWQTGDNNRGYAYCGDWRPAHEKISDMAAHVERVHRLGMKYVLWYSVVFVGKYSEHYGHFKDMFLYYDEGMGAGVLDPRYPEVREFLIGIYLKALDDWKLDGFKLDFIDTWCGSAPYKTGMDIKALSDAVDVFMTDATNALREKKPDILLEFRQNYIGPNMRKYGNMFRVADCPNDFLTNRAGVIDLRMTMRSSAVHSDMLMWHPNEAPELAAVQMIGVLFGVMQYSAKLEKMSDSLFKTSAFWLDFMKKHRRLLLESKLEAFEPQCYYTWARASERNECAIAVYSSGHTVDAWNYDTVYIANGSMSGQVVMCSSGTYDATVRNCFGEIESRGRLSFDECIKMIKVPVGGLLTLKKR